MAENANQGGSYTRNPDGSLTLVERTGDPKVEAEKAETTEPAVPAKRTTKEK